MIQQEELHHRRLMCNFIQHIRREKEQYLYSNTCRKKTPCLLLGQLIHMPSVIRYQYVPVYEHEYTLLRQVEGNLRYQCQNSPHDQTYSRQHPCIRLPKERTPLFRKGSSTRKTA